LLYAAETPLGDRVDTFRLEPFTGSHVEGTIAVSAAAVNEILRTSGPPLADVTLELRPGNQLIVRYGILHASATLEPEIEAGASPRVAVTLASFAIALALRAAVRQPFLSFSGRRLVINLAEVPALAGARGLWPHLRQAGFSTDEAGVRVDLIVDIAGDPHA
jgi:hypothetical protein